jgi:hypothetical protein
LRLPVSLQPCKISCHICWPLITQSFEVLRQPNYNGSLEISDQRLSVLLLTGVTWIHSPLSDLISPWSCFVPLLFSMVPL